jgi:hypothetical protein
VQGWIHVELRASHRVAYLCLEELINGGIVEVASALQQHLARMASIKLPPNHHHRLLLEVLASLDLYMMGWLQHALNRLPKWYM